MTASLKDIDVSGKRVLVRVDYNVSFKEGKVVDDKRIQATLPTITFLLEQQAQQVVLMSHCGRPKGEPDPALSLAPVATHLAELLGEEVAFVDDCVDKPLPETRVVLLENLRFHKEEKKNDPAFAKKLAEHGDIYVTDAFGSLHRAHASVDATARLFETRAAGLLVEKEITNLALQDPERPYIAMIGAAKISDKIEIMEALLERVDKLLLGGAIIFPFFKALGYEVGKSLCEEESIPTAKALLDKYGEKIILPEDIVISEELEGMEIFTVDKDKIPPTMKGLDIGDQTVERFKEELDSAATVFWNGPVGVFEVHPFDTATKELAEFLAQKKIRVVVGGGDTASAVKKLGFAEFYTHVSTGGGASLQYIAGKELPGLLALEK
jgi:phosphoglycerate kinase